jgi:holo-[acyl-carrier protein] synthase
MSITGIGSDIVKVSRIERLIEKSGDRFLARIYTPAEIEYARSLARPALHFAARFAAKEAFVKALGSGFRDGIEWHDIEVINNQLGRPGLNLQGRARKLCHRLGAEAWLSLAHEQEFALAFVVLEKKEDTP